MLKRWQWLVWFTLAATLLACRDAVSDSGRLHLVQTIALPGVAGRLDHMTADVKHHRLYVAALGNDSVELIDLTKGVLENSSSAIGEPQGIEFLLDTNEVVTSCAADGTCAFLDPDTLAREGDLALGSDADNIRFDPRADEVVIGYGSGGLAWAAVAQPHVALRAELPGHPESFELETSGSRVFVNVPSAKAVEVIDRSTGALVDTWPIVDAAANYPMALDESRDRLLVGCRRPPRLIAFDTGTGKVAATVVIDADCDDIFVDAKRELVYVTCGAGFIDVLSEKDYKEVERVSTRTGARTGLLVPELDMLYVAVPHRGNKDAEIRAYSLQ